MQIVQRSFLVVVLALCLTVGISFLYKEKEERSRTQWEQLQTEQFLNKLSRNGVCTYEEYLIFYMALNACGDVAKVRLEEYQKEKDRAGNSYWYLVSWEEILQTLLEEGEYYFQENSALELYVEWGTGKKNQGEYYYGIVC